MSTTETETTAPAPVEEFVSWYGMDGHLWEYYADPETGRAKLGGGSLSWHLTDECRGCKEGEPVYDW